MSTHQQIALIAILASTAGLLVVTQPTTTTITGLVCQAYTTIDYSVFIFALVLMLLGGTIYSFITITESSARVILQNYAMAMILGGVIAAIIGVLAPYIIALLTGVSTTGSICYISTTTSSSTSSSSTSTISSTSSSSTSSTTSTTSSSTSTTSSSTSTTTTTTIYYPPMLAAANNPTFTNTPDLITANAVPSTDHIEILISGSVYAEGVGNTAYTLNSTQSGVFNVTAHDLNNSLSTTEFITITAPNTTSPLACRATIDRTIDLSPVGGLANSYNEIHSTIITLGKKGGGMIRLAPGTYYIYNEINVNYSNVTIIGSGMGETILSLPPDPLQNFTIEPEGVLVGTYNSTTGEAEGLPGHLFRIPVYNTGFGLCNLTLDANIQALNEDWQGSLILDTFGGKNHTYENIAMANLDGLQPGPNGVNIGCPGTPCARAASGYIIENLVSTNYDIVDTGQIHGGPGFLVVRMLSNATITGVDGTGVIEFDGPAIDSIMSDWNVKGHLLLEPFPVPWGNSTFENVTFDVTSFPYNSPHAPTPIAVPQMVNGTTGVRGQTNFTGLHIVDSRFLGGYTEGLGNAYYIKNSLFETAVDSIPEYFINNTVIYPVNRTYVLPIMVGGAVHSAWYVTMENDRFVFPNGTEGSDAFQLGTGNLTWSDSAVSIAGSASPYLFSAPNITLTSSSYIGNLTYFSSAGAPPKLSIIDIANSQGFTDQGAKVGTLTNIVNNLP